ncbi:MAG TPA: hypothetical protein VEY09_14605 [Pyrinomonadaceae bacterium]|nr:hypothetical protein [Pyrinomonadaceae bacterium]
MKLKIALAILAFALPVFLPPCAAAQSRDKKITAGPAKIEAKVPPHVRNVTAMEGVPPSVLGASGNSLYDVSTVSNGARSNQRTPSLSGGTASFVGIAFDLNNTLYGITPASQGNPSVSRIFSIGPNYSYSTLGAGPALKLLNNTPFGLTAEGDIAFHKSSNTLYALCRDNSGVWQLATISLSTGTVEFKGPLPPTAGTYGPPAYHALAVNASGNLYALDTNNRVLYKLNRADASVLEVKALTGLPTSVFSATTGGMGFSSSGMLLASVGNSLVLIDPSTGVSNVVGTGGFSGLIVSGGSGPVIHQ